jgi:RNA polymerase sigma factor (sigma-70 family)
MNETDDWQRLIGGLRSGDQQVAREFCEQYGPALHRIAEKNLPGGLRRRVGAEDIVQSACRTFLRRARDQQFQLADSESLWRLMCAITLTKVREQTRFHLRQKRGLRQEVRGIPSDSEAGLQLAASQPAPDQAAIFADQFRHVLSLLDEEERKIVDLKLQDCTNEQVAEAMGSSERTVRRMLKRLRDRMERDFEVP